MATEIKQIQALYVIGSPKQIVLDSLEEAINRGGNNVNWHVFVKGAYGVCGDLHHFGQDLTTLMAIPKVGGGNLEAHALNYFWTWLEMLPRPLRQYVCLIRGKYLFEDGWLDKAVDALEGGDEATQGMTVITPLPYLQSPETGIATARAHHVDPPPLGVWLTDYDFFTRHGFPGINEKSEEYYDPSMADNGEIFGGLNEATVKPWNGE